MTAFEIKFFAGSNFAILPKFRENANVSSVKVSSFKYICIYISHEVIIFLLVSKSF